MRVCGVEKQYNPQPSFSAGNFSLYSDFDGTYMPFEHRDICVYNCYENNYEARRKFNAFFAPFQDFLNRFGDKFNFIITTGRNRPEVNYFLNKLKNQGADLPKPDTLITCDGKAIFYRNGSCYPETTLDKEKRDGLSKKLNWYPETIMPQIKQIISQTPTVDGKRNVAIIQTPINKNSIDYEDISLQYVLDNDGAIRENFASFNEGYDFAPYIVFSDNIDTENIKKKLEALFASKNINARVDLCKEDWDVQYGKSFQSISIKLYSKEGFWKNKKTNKLIDTHKKVEDVYRGKTDDLVIAAGDAGNDEDMLNIFNYVDILGLKIPKPEDYEEFLKNPQNRKLLKQLPIVSVVVGNKSDLNLIRSNQELLNEYGIHKTVFVDYEKDEILLDGVKKAVKIYSQENENFKAALGKDLLDEIGADDAKPFSQECYDKLLMEIMQLFKKIDAIKEALYD